jgi:hypothetical protein
LFIQGLLKDFGMENRLPAARSFGLAGMEPGRVKSRLKRAKTASKTRSSERWRVPNRGSGRPQTTYCFGMMQEFELE